MAAKIVTYPDTGVLLASWSGAEPRREKARRLLSDPARTLVGSAMLALELLPHATYNDNAAEVRFMSGILARIQNVPIDAEIVARALDLGRRYGVSGADALHTALAEAGGVEQFVTTENRTKPLFRVLEFQVVHLDDLPTDGAA